MRRGLLLGVIISVIAITGCKKDKLEPNPDTGAPVLTGLISYDADTEFTDLDNLTPQDRVLLMQEFTGVYCYTCPLAHYITSDLIQMYPNRIAAMNIHSHFYSIYDDPNVMGNLYDFRTEDGDSMVSMLGGVMSVPSAAFNMKLLAGEANITSNARDNWMGYASNELSTPPKVNIEMATSFDNSTRNVKIVVKYHALEDLNENLYHSIAIVENDIIDKQFVDTAVVNDYHHMHIFRDMVTDAKADFIGITPTQGQVFIKVFNYTIPAEWNENNIDVISYVHQKDANWNVYQTSIKQIQ
ncbi:MAG: Omp28-related outer membrane protein [Crocinitomicaceae bacterium]|nr:Omp28-related outer membrane protein [Crocinitomicaceae bacterium]